MSKSKYISYRSRINDLKYKFGGKYSCIFGTRLDNGHLSNCEVLCEGKPSFNEYKIISNGSIKQQKEIIQTFNRNKKTFDKFTLAQESP